MNFVSISMINEFIDWFEDAQRVWFHLTQGAEDVRRGAVYSLVREYSTEKKAELTETQLLTFASACYDGLCLKGIPWANELKAEIQEKLPQARKEVLQELANDVKRRRPNRPALEVDFRQPLKKPTIPDLSKF